MSRFTFTNYVSKRMRYVMGIAAMAVVLVSVVLMQQLASRTPNTSSLEQVAPAGQPMGSGGAVAALTLQSRNGTRPTDAYSEQLDSLRRRSFEVTRLDAPSRYGVLLEELARQGRAALAETRLPDSPNAYVEFLDDLRRLGQAVDKLGGESMDVITRSAFFEDALPADPNAYSSWLDHLRRLGQAASEAGETP